MSGTREDNEMSLEDRASQLFGLTDADGPGDNGSRQDDNDDEEVNPARPAANKQQEDDNEQGTVEQTAQPTGPVKPNSKQGDKPNTKGQPARQANGNNPETPPPVAPRGGAEARLHNSLQMTRRQLEQETLARTAAEAKLQGYEQAQKLMSDLELQPTDVVNAMQFIAHFRKDTLGAVKNMLAEAQAMGVDLSQVVGGNGVAVQPAAIKRMIDEAVKPFGAFINDRTQQVQQTERERAVQQQYAELTADFPWVMQNEQELAEVLDADNRLSTREAVLMLHNWALQNGYDVNKPLRAQHLAALESRNQPQQPVARNNALSQTRPARSPGPRLSGSGTIVEQRSAAPVPANRRYKDIMQEVLEEHGIPREGLL